MKNCIAASFPALRLTLWTWFVCCSGIARPADPDAYPNFSWETVPVAFHFGKDDGLLNEEESRFVASHSGLVCLEKGHARGEFEHTEVGIEREARQLKKLNPEIKVVFYWNAFLDYPMFRAHDEYQRNPQWWLRTADGTLDKKNDRLMRYDLSKPEVREWWTDVAKAAVDSGECDGVFMDAFPQIVSRTNEQRWGRKKYDAVRQGLIDLIRETRAKIGNDKLIFYNGIRNTPNGQLGNEFLQNTDAAMIEHFGHFQSRSKEAMLRDIEAMSQAGQRGKIVVFKAWPGFSWLDQDAMKRSPKEKRRLASKNITFPLAAFLAGAQEHCYFIYNWGYRSEHGCLEWYPELDRPLGKPLGAMTKNGWLLRREFEHASVRVNLETRAAEINWHAPTESPNRLSADTSRTTQRPRYLETGGKRHLEVVYKTVAGKELKLDLYQPTASPSQKCPVVVFTHGGGWAAGSRFKAASGSFRSVFERLLENGFAVAPVSYRLAKKNSNVAIRDCVVDCKDAIRYLANNSESFGIDPERIGVMGDSAGGHLAQMLLLSSPEQLSGEPALSTVPYKMIAGVSWYGPSDFENRDLFNHDDRPNFNDRFADRILASNSGPRDALARYREISPVNYLRKSGPPLLLIQGDKDTTIPVKHAHYMKRKADRLAAPVEIMIVKNAGHNWRSVDAAIQPSRDVIIERTVQFFVDHLND